MDGALQWDILAVEADRATMLQHLSTTVVAPTCDAFLSILTALGSIASLHLRG
jgi:hypothetical protein